jgi:hypothetical protein
VGRAGPRSDRHAESRSPFPGRDRATLDITVSVEHRRTIGGAKGLILSGGQRIHEGSAHQPGARYRSTISDASSANAGQSKAFKRNETYLDASRSGASGAANFGRLRVFVVFIRSRSGQGRRSHYCLGVYCNRSSSARCHGRCLSICVDSYIIV